MVGLVSRIKSSLFGYDVLDPRNRRKSTFARVKREDDHLKGGRRERLQETAADLCRNMSLASWMVRRHVDYVAQMRFQARTPDSDLNDEIERLMVRDGRPERADVAGRFSREKIFRLSEVRRVLDGDLGLLKMANGTLQGIQQNHFRDPDSTEDGETWFNGVRINSVGAKLEYGVRSYNPTDQASPVVRISADRMIHYGFFDRFATDQVRGISPIVTALNPLRDVYENFNYALAKAKVHQLFALAFFRESADAIGDIEEIAGSRGTKEEDGEIVEGDEPPEYEVDFSGGPQVFNLDPGDRAEFLESKSPSNEFQSFTQLVVMVALKALDIPYSFYDEKHTNFFGSRAAWLHYERACRDKREDQQEMRRQYTIWKLRQWVLSGELVLPDGMVVDDVEFEWIPKGMPWWDPSKEIRGHVDAIRAGLDTPQRICRMTDTDFYENVKAIKEAQDFAAENDVTLDFGSLGSQAADLAEGPNPASRDEDDDEEEDEEGDE